MSITERVKVGVACIVTREQEDGSVHVLMGTRRGAHGAGTLSPPGGKPDGGESPEQAAIRELREETNLVAIDAVPLGYWSYDKFPEDDLHYVTLYFHMDVPDLSTLKLMEPLKCSGWEWFDRYAHPSDEHAIPRDTVYFAGVEYALQRIL